MAVVKALQTLNAGEAVDTREPCSSNPGSVNGQQVTLEDSVDVP